MRRMEDSETTRPAVSPAGLPESAALKNFDSICASRMSRIAWRSLKKTIWLLTNSPAAAKVSHQPTCEENADKKCPARYTTAGSANLKIFSADKGSGSSDVPIYIECHCTPAGFFRALW